MDTGATTTAGNLGSINVILGADARKFISTLNRADRALTRFSRRMSEMGMRWSTRMFLPVAYAAGRMVKAAGEFEYAMYTVGAVTQSTQEQFDGLIKRAKELGATTPFTAREVAGAMQFMGMAGLSAKTIYEGVDEVLNLAATSGIDLAKSADIVTNVMAGYQLQVHELGRAVDILTKAFISSNTNLVQLAHGFKYVGPIAKAFGLEIEEVVAAIGLLGNAGIQSTMAGVQLRRGLSNLLRPTRQMQQAMDRLGIVINEDNSKLAKMRKELQITTDDTRDMFSMIDKSTGQMIVFKDAVDAYAESLKHGRKNTVTLTQVIESLEQAMERTGGDLQAIAPDIIQIFGIRAAPGWLALLSQGSEALSNFTDQLRDSANIADYVARTKLQGYKGMWERLRAAWEGISITIGNRLMPVLRVLSQGFVWYNQTLQVASDTTFGFGLALGALLLSIPLVMLAVAGLGYLLSPMNLLIAGMVTLGAMATFVYLNWDKLGGPLMDLWQELKRSFLETVEGWVGEETFAKLRSVNTKFESFTTGLRDVVMTIGNHLTANGFTKIVTAWLGIVFGKRLIGAIAALKPFSNGVKGFVAAVGTILKRGAWPLMLLGWIGAGAHDVLTAESLQLSEFSTTIGITLTFLALKLARRAWPLMLAAWLTSGQGTLAQLEKESSVFKAFLDDIRKSIEDFATWLEKSPVWQRIAAWAKNFMDFKKSAERAISGELTGWLDMGKAAANFVMGIETPKVEVAPEPSVLREAQMQARKAVTTALPRRAAAEIGVTVSPTVMGLKDLPYEVKHYAKMALDQSPVREPLKAEVPIIAEFVSDRAEVQPTMERQDITTTLDVTVVPVVMGTERLPYETVHYAQMALDDHQYHRPLSAEIPVVVTPTTDLASLSLPMNVDRVDLDYSDDVGTSISDTFKADEIRQKLEHAASQQLTPITLEQFIEVNPSVIYGSAPTIDSDMTQTLTPVILRQPVDVKHDVVYAPVPDIGDTVQDAVRRDMSPVTVDQPIEVNVELKLAEELDRKIQEFRQQLSDPGGTHALASTITALVPELSISSMKRSHEHNKEIGGAAHSRHTLGLAADFVVPHAMRNPQDYAALEKQIKAAIRKAVPEGLREAWELVRYKDMGHFHLEFDPPELKEQFKSSAERHRALAKQLVDDWQETYDALTMITSAGGTEVNARVKRQLELVSVQFEHLKEELVGHSIYPDMWSAIKAVTLKAGDENVALIAKNVDASLSEFDRLQLAFKDLTKVSPEDLVQQSFVRHAMGRQDPASQPHGRFQSTFDEIGLRASPDERAKAKVEEAERSAQSRLIHSGYQPIHDFLVNFSGGPESAAGLRVSKVLDKGSEAFADLTVTPEMVLLLQDGSKKVQELRDEFEKAKDSYDELMNPTIRGISNKFNLKMLEVKATDALTRDLANIRGELGTFDVIEEKLRTHINTMLELRKLRNQGGVGHDEYEAYAIAYNKHLKEVGELSKLQEVRNIVQDVGRTINQTIQGMVEGVWNGTRRMSDAFLQLGQNIVIGLQARIIQRAVDRVMDSLDDLILKVFETKQATGSAGGGFWDQLIGVGIDLLGGALGGAIGGGIPQASFAPRGIPTARPRAPQTPVGGGLAIIPTTGIPPVARARGGPLNQGQVALVGERGKELFVPSSAGRVVSNDAMSSLMQPVVEVNVHNHSTATATAKRKRNMYGDSIEVVISDQIANDARSGGPGIRAIQQVLGQDRALTRR